jgi:hypothetical protein
MFKNLEKLDETYQTEAYSFCVFQLERHAYMIRNSYTKSRQVLELTLNIKELCSHRNHLNSDNIASFDPILMTSR